MCTGVVGGGQLFVLCVKGVSKGVGSQRANFLCHHGIQCAAHHHHYCKYSALIVLLISTTQVVHIVHEG